ncbi:ATP-binding cassette domain-containing protein, partial [uncultured Aeromicrobium sp.]|uniref:ATP-binding cassette domain-containing protein n=1 Tax=uncultured Aeromicrobium sp. TaxID=337820 RepID=UPI0025D138B5
AARGAGRREARRRVRSEPFVLTAPPRRAAPTGAPLLTAEDITVAYGPTRAVGDVDLVVRSGEVLVVMGRNGSGKSSLLWALQGTGPRSGGEVRVGSPGVDPHLVSPDEARTLVGLVPQTAADLLYLETVAEECAAADSQSGSPAGTCLELLERLAPGIDAARHPRDLSEGQRLAVVLAIVLSGRPHVIALDEPTRGLDYRGKAELADVVRALADAGHGIVVSTHDVEFAATIADTVVVMADGEVVSRGRADQVLAESPAFAPQVSKVLGPQWLTVGQVQRTLL